MPRARRLEGGAPGPSRRGWRWSPGGIPEAMRPIDPAAHDGLPMGAGLRSRAGPSGRRIQELVDRPVCHGTIGEMVVRPAGARTREPEASGPAGPRERILDAASRLFTRQGIGRTGVDSLIATAGVAKATFYRHFPSKEDLILAWLRDSRTRWFHRVRAIAEANATTPAERVPRLFEAAAEWLEAGDYRGCPYLNTAVELVDPNRPPGHALRDYLAEIGAYLEEQAKLAG